MIAIREEYTGMFYVDIGKEPYAIKHHKLFQSHVGEYISNIMNGDARDGDKFMRAAVILDDLPDSERDLYDAINENIRKRSNGVTLRPNETDTWTPLFAASCYPNQNNGWIIIRSYNMNLNGAPWKLKSAIDVLPEAIRREIRVQHPQLDRYLPTLEALDIVHTVIIHVDHQH